MIIALVVVCAVTTVNALKCYISAGDVKKEMECTPDVNITVNATGNQPKLQGFDIPGMGDISNAIMDALDNLRKTAKDAGIGASCFKATDPLGSSLLRISL